MRIYARRALPLRTAASVCWCPETRRTACGRAWLGRLQRVGRLPNEGRRVLGAVVTGLSVMLGPTMGVSGRQLADLLTQPSYPM